MGIQFDINVSIYINKFLLLIGEVCPSPSGSYHDESGVSTALIVDEDTCSREELEGLFKVKFRIEDESAVSLNRDYVLNLAADRYNLYSSIVHLLVLCYLYKYIIQWIYAHCSWLIKRCCTYL